MDTCDCVYKDTCVHCQKSFQKAKKLREVGEPIYQSVGLYDS